MILYTTPEAILSTLGLSPEDLEPNYFQSSDLLRLLRIDLFEWLPTHSSLIVNEVTALSEDLNKYDLLVTYCTYFCSARTALAAYAFKSRETDGTSAYERNAVDFFKLSEEFQRKANLYKEKLTTIVNVANVTPRVAQFTFVEPNTNPVTG
jgi:hypothetical protein